MDRQEKAVTEQLGNAITGRQKKAAVERRSDASNQDSSIALTNECPTKDKDGNCLVPGVYSDSDEIGGG